MHPSERVYTRWPDVEGYCTPLSAPAGSRIELRAASRADTFSVEVARWALEPEVVWSTSGVRADDHPVPERAWETGCGWPVAVEIPTDDSWPSGFYEVTLRADDAEGSQVASQAFFVVRGPEPRHPALLVLATNTYNA